MEAIFVGRLSEILGIIIENKEWLFSGIGSTIGNELLNNMKKKKSVDSYVTNVVNNNLNIHNNYNFNSVKIDDNEIFELVNRFISIYENHGIGMNQISSFSGSDFNFKLLDFKAKNSILEILDDKFIDWTCNKFGVERS